jgi:Sodium/hydrogen exchanger family
VPLPICSLASILGRREMQMQMQRPPWGDHDFYGWKTNAFEEDRHVIVSLYLLIFSLILCTSLVVQYLIGHVWHLKRLPEAAGTMLVGIAIGGIIRLSGSAVPTSGTIDMHGASSSEVHSGFNPGLLGFSPTVFFFGFLPPIIFNSGYHLKRKLFYANFGGIFALAFVGTCISCAIVALLLFLLGNYTALAPSASTLTLIGKSTP